MKLQTASSGAEKQLHVPPAHQFDTAASSRKPAHQLQLSNDDLREHIATRAYQLYVQRGWREDCSLEDWLDAEREILNRKSPS
ncbi:MAG: DUF2934 domain-containing protein [Nitrospiraceae bacterium]